MVIVGAVTILGAGTIFTTMASAQANDAQNPMSSLVQKIADKFNLNKDDVQKVFDEQHDEMRKTMEAKHQERLDQLVKDGKITEAQKTLIQKKMKELQAQRESERDSFKDLTPEEMKAKMDQHRSEMENWAKENGIDPKYFMGDFVIKIKGGGHGEKHMFFRQ